MRYFSKKFLDFFQGLEENNNREWFLANKALYETEVKAPFTELVRELIDRINRQGGEIISEPKDAIFRLNRDIRFSEDKRPYKLHMAANLSSGGRRNHEVPGFYFQFGARQVLIGGGCYTLEKDTLFRVRKYIAAHGRQLDTLLDEPSFKEKYGELLGEKNKLLPVDFRETLKKQPLIANKQFYYMSTVKPDIVLKENLPDFLMDFYKAGKAIKNYLSKAVLHR